MDASPPLRHTNFTVKPKLFGENEKWRFFYTQQHGDNVTYEVIQTPARE